VAETLSGQGHFWLQDVGIRGISMRGQFFVVLPDGTSQRIALIRSGNGYQLPGFKRDPETRFNTVGSVNEAVAAAWKIRVTVVRCLVDGTDTQDAVFVLHNHNKQAALPPQAVWVEISRLKELDYVSPTQRQLIFDWLVSEQDEAWQQVPWSSPNWLTRVTEWIHKAVHATGAKVIGEPQQVRTWAISCVYRIETTGGALYLKGLPDLLGHEPMLTQHLLKQFPQNIPEVTAIEPNEHWMLTVEMRGPEPQSRADWELVLRTLSQFQHHCNQNLNELLNFGVKYRPLAKLPELLAPVVSELDRPEMRAFYEVTPQEADTLAGRIRALPSLCAELADCGIPDTLIHGDLWGPNVIMQDEFSGKSPIIYDWSDAAISHPYFDIFCLLWAEKDDARRYEEKEAQVKVWTESYPHKKVMRAFELAEQVAPYYYLIAWRNVELHAPEHSRWELMYLLLRFVRRILVQPPRA
jgi:hypothetical protein